MEDLKNDSQEKLVKPKLYLDLDNTIICSEPLDTMNVKMNKNKASKFTFHNMDNYYIVFERPYLEEFLDYVFKYFDVNVWTAASKSYALFIVENILCKDKPDRKVKIVLFSYHCKWSEKTNKDHKGLKLLWENLPDHNKDNTLIIDDLEEVYDCQPENCINIKPFEFTSEFADKDAELLKVRDKLDDYLNKNLNKNLNRDNLNHNLNQEKKLS